MRFGTDKKNSFYYPREDFYETGGVDEGVYTILDTGASALYISSLYFDSFMSELQAIAGTELQPYEGRTYARCVPSFPDLYFQVNGKWLQVAVKDYVIDVSRNSDGSICLIQVMQTSTPFNILGMPLFIDYQAVFDDKASTVSFDPIKGSIKDAIEYDDSRPEFAFSLLTQV